MVRSGSCHIHHFGHMSFFCVENMQNPGYYLTGHNYVFLMVLMLLSWAKLSLVAASAAMAGSLSSASVPPAAALPRTHTWSRCKSCLCFCLGQFRLTNTGTCLFVSQILKSSEHLNETRSTQYHAWGWVQALSCTKRQSINYPQTVCTRHVYVKYGGICV